MGFAVLNPSYELCHLITEPLYSKASTQFVSKTEVEDEKEKSTDHLAVMVQWGGCRRSRKSLAAILS